VNRRKQESEHHQAVVHAPSAFIVEDAPERHESDENRRGPLLSEVVREAERLRRIRLQHRRKQQRR